MMMMSCFLGFSSSLASPFASPLTTTPLSISKTNRCIIFKLQVDWNAIIWAGEKCSPPLRSKKSYTIQIARSFRDVLSKILTLCLKLGALLGYAILKDLCVSLYITILPFHYSLRSAKAPPFHWPPSLAPNAKCGQALVHLVTESGLNWCTMESPSSFF